MTSIWGQLLLLVVFSVALAATVSGYRDDDPSQILRGTVRRSLMFFLAVGAIGIMALSIDRVFLRP